jgi:hypothetical protein
MKKCSHPDHPHCTMWVLPGDDACAAGHLQAGDAPALAPPVPASSFDLLKSLRNARPQQAAIAAAAAIVTPRPYLHVSGFDPRAAGGRQSIKLELRGMPEHAGSVIHMQLQSALLQNGNLRQSFVRTLHGDWRPVFVEFSSRGMEHGQYRLEVDLHSMANGRIERHWACTLVILVPRADATLTQVHDTYLATHKNVRVMADDASIARVNARTPGTVDIDVTARNAGIAHLDLEAKGGKAELGFSTIAWDEDLIEIAVTDAPPMHPFSAHAGCIVNASPMAGAQRHIRLFALAEAVIGRHEQFAPEANILLYHFGEHGPERNGLTRRISGRHAAIRRTPAGFELEDLSRFGLLVDGEWPGKYKPVPLRVGMRIELTASIKGIVELQVTALMAHAVILHRTDGGRHAECIYLMAPETRPGYPMTRLQAVPQGAAMPVLFHAAGGFWHFDPATGKETALAPHASLERLAQVPAHCRFNAAPYPEGGVEIQGYQGMLARQACYLDAPA